MATLPERAMSRAAVVDSLIGQVDQLIISSGDAGDQMKFAACANAPDIFLAVDDDLIYPPDYVATTLAWLDKYPDRIISYHGWVAGAHGDHIENYRCMEALDDPREVDVAGTGVCAFHISTIRPLIEDFRGPNQADLWLAILAERKGVGRVVVPHPERWFGYTEWPRTIWHDTAQRLGGRFDANETKAVALPELLGLLTERRKLEEMAVA
jgi:hypothetical protein